MQKTEVKKEPKMDIKRTQNLKAYAVFSCNKTLDLNAIKSMSVISVVFAYTDVEAVTAHQGALKEFSDNNGQHFALQNMIAPALMSSADLQEVIGMVRLRKDLQRLAPVKKKKEKVMELKVVKDVPPDRKAKKDLVSYVRYMFNESGTKADREISEKVINKFAGKKIASML